MTKPDPAAPSAGTATSPAAPGPNTVPLTEPIGEGEHVIKELTLRKPGPGELRGVQLGMLAAGDVSMLIKILPRIAMPPINEAQAAGMELGDFTECYAVIQGFLRA